MSVDRQEFTGWGTKIEDTDESLQHLWTGYRAPPVSWTGIWDEPNGSGNMILVQDKTTVTGTYEYYTTPGSITGTISEESGGFILIGTYTEDDDSGIFSFRMSDDGKKFAGWYMHDGVSGDENKYDWNGVRRGE